MASPTEKVSTGLQSANVAKRQPSSAFRPDIEGLRGIAVLIVVAFHSGIPGFSGGFVGVDVFFVLSGYLITGLLVAEIRKTSRLSLLQFYARRVRRLLPASAVVLAITILVGSIVMAPQELLFAGRAARATALYMSNVFFGINASDYFAPDVESNPMLHTWSLAVEEQFYLFWPLLIMLGLQFWRSRKALLGILAGLTIISLAVSVWLTANGGTFAFYGLPARAWEFGIGGLAVLLPRGAVNLPRNVWLAIGWLSVLTILGSGCWISSINFPGWIALAPVLGTAVALIVGAEHPHDGPGILLDSAPMQFLGELSYSWYLWHWPFLVFSTALFPNISVAGKLVAVILALVVAMVTHSTIENPIRFHPGLVKRPALSLYLAAAVTMFSLGVAFLSIRFAVRMANAPEMRKITAAVDDIARMQRQECVSLGDSADLKTCVFGSASSATHLILFGDSHAIQWFNPLRTLAESKDWKLTTIVKSGCPATDITPPDSNPRAATNCTAWREEAIRRIVELRPSVVFVASATNYLAHKDARGTRGGVSLDEWREGTRRTLRALTGAGLNVAAMRDNPISSFDIPTCLARSERHSWYPGGSCKMEKAVALDPAVFEAEQAAARGLPGVNFIDLTDYLCRGDSCQTTTQNGMVMYRDNNHLTGTFADSLAQVLEVRLSLSLSNSGSSGGS